MEEHKRTIAEEELSALETPVAARINAVPVPLDNPVEFDAKVMKTMQQFPVFKTREDAEYFSMLPLSRKDSINVLHRALEIQREESQTKQPVSEK